MFSQAVADDICEQVAEGKSLREVCRQADMPALSTVMKWADERPAFSEQYTRAMYLRADCKFDELDEVSTDAVRAESAVEVAGLRLKADNIKWQLARMAPKKYGDKLETTLQGPNGQPLQIESIKRVIVDPSGTGT